jgi:hypothetical protein
MPGNGTLAIDESNPAGRMKNAALTGAGRAAKG